MRGKGVLLFGNLKDMEKVENISLENSKVFGRLSDHTWQTRYWSLYFCKSRTTVLLNIPCCQ